jgi:exodeoxyribonuclease V alpha subunit
MMYHPIDGWRVNPASPLDADVVIVDELSMVSTDVAYHLFRGLRPGTAVVLIGDHHQLLPVGAGALLRDCITHGLVPSTILKHCHRQAGVLRRNCAEILAGYVPPSVKDGDEPRPWYVIGKLDTAEEIMDGVGKLFADVIPRWGFDRIKDAQFITARNKDDDASVHAINLHLQYLHQLSLGVKTRIHPDEITWTDDGADSVPLDAQGNIVEEDEIDEEGEKKFKLYPGDKVIHTKNNYDLDVMNGDCGIVVNVDPLVVKYDGRADPVVYQPTDEEQVRLAYCLTVHKTQGSEYPCVVVVVKKSQASLLHDRSWIYTAATRAKRTLVVLGDRYSIERAARLNRMTGRQTILPILAGAATVAATTEPAAVTAG